MIQAASALEYLHASGLIHADVAARNLCLVHEHNRIVCKLTDFGLSKRLDPAHEHIRGGPKALSTLHDELVTTKASPLSFKFPEGVFARTGDAFPEPARITTNGCLRRRTSERIDMATVRRRLQDCSLCDAAMWEQDQVHEWLYRMGVPRDEAVLDSDLFASVSNFDELCSELIDDNYRADYLDPEVHAGFTPDLSRRIVIELKAMKDLLAFKDHEGEGWQRSIAGSSKDDFAWMSKYQAAPRTRRRRLRRNRRTSQGIPQLGGRRHSQQRISELYAGENTSLYTTGTDEPSTSVSSSTQSTSEGATAWASGGESKAQPVEDEQSLSIEMMPPDPGAQKSRRGEGKSEERIGLRQADELGGRKMWQGNPLSASEGSKGSSAGSVLPTS
eukprot:g1147.t1